MDIRRFHGLSIDWRGGGLVIVREGIAIFELSGCPCNVSLKVEAEDQSESEHCVLLEVAAGPFRWLFFLDFDGLQTNMREVAPNLRSLQAVRDWLLPPGYVQRQGDIGIYAVDINLAREISAAEGAVALNSVLKGRHALEVVGGIRYFERDGIVVVKTDSVTRLMHPEHAPVELASGSYRFVAASGVVYPIWQDVRDASGLPLL